MKGNNLGKKVWNIFVDIYSINDDGNLMDAAGIGAILAMKNAKMPKYDKETERVLFDEKTNKGIPLKEVPITYHPDTRQRHSNLNQWRDGFRDIVFILQESWFFKKYK